MPHSIDRKTAFTHIWTARGHLIARVLTPNVGQREVAIVTSEIGDAITELQSEGKGRAMVLDLSDVRMLSSMGLGMCIACRNQANALGATSILFGMNKDLQALMAMMKIEKMYKIAKNNDELQKLVR